MTEAPKRPKRDKSDFKAVLTETKGAEKAAEAEKNAPRLVSITKNFRLSMLAATPWLVVGYAMRGAVTNFAAKGGTGKTQFTLQAAVHHALGENFLHFQLNVKAGGFLRTVFVSGEESEDEIRRRIAAICIDRCSDKEGKYDPEEVDTLLEKLSDRLFVYTGKNVALITRGKDGKAERTRFRDELMADAMAGKFDLVVLDPQIRLHEGFDESAAEIQELHNCVDEVGTEANVGVIIVGHMRKSTSESVADQHSSRGHSSITDGARIVLQAAGMTMQEAKDMGVSEDKHRYVKLGDPKQSYAESGRFAWIRKQQVRLPVALLNGNHDTRFVLKPVDLVQKSSLTTAQLRPILQRIKDGPDKGKLYTDATSGDTAPRAEAMIQELLELAHVREAREVLRMLVRLGMVQLVPQPCSTKNPRRKLPSFCKFASWKPVEQRDLYFTEGESDDMAEQAGIG